MSHVEVMTAMLLLAGGLLSLAAGSGWMIRSGLGVQDSFGRTAALQATVEEISGVRSDELASGHALQGDFEVSWTLQDSELVEFVAVGPLPPPGDAQSAVVTGRVRADTLHYRSAPR